MCNVNVVSGEVIRWEVDLYLPGFIPVEVRRVYRSTSVDSGLMGIGWMSNLNVYLTSDGRNFVLHDDNGTDVSLTYSAESRTARDAAGRRVLASDGQFLVLDQGDGKKYRFGPRATLDARLHLASIHDRDGNKVQFEYDAEGRLRRLTDTLNRTVRFTCDHVGRMVEVGLLDEFDSSRFVTYLRYSFSGQGDLIRVEKTLNRAVTYEYVDHLVVRETDPRGNSIYWAYDASRRCVRTWRTGGILFRALDFDDVGRQVRVTDTLGFSSLFKYNEQGRITDIIDPLGNHTENVYDPQGNLLLSSNGHDTPEVTLFDPATNCLSQSDPQGRMTRHYFDNEGRRIKTVTPDGREWTQHYDDRGHVVRRVDCEGDEWIFEYAPQGYVHRATNPLGHDIYQERNTNGTLVNLSDGLGPRLQSRYDRLGNLIAITNAAGRTTHFSYDAADRLTSIESPGGEKRTCDYDAAGNVIAVSDEVGSRFGYEYDAAGKPIRVVGPLGSSLTFHYDGEERLIRVVNWKGEETRIAHDALGRPNEVRLFDGRVHRYEHDAAHRLISVTNGRGERVAYEYDPTGAVAKTVFPDQSAIDVVFENGFPVLSTAGDIVISREFDSRSRMVREARGSWHVTLAYDGSDNLRRVEDSTGRTISYEYDSRRRLVRLIDSVHGVHEFSYNAVDLMIEWRSPGLVRQMQYDQGDRLVELVVRNAAGAVVVQRQYVYDEADRLIRLSSRSAAAPNPTRREYSYDRMHRLLAVLGEDGAPIETYDYDVSGNIVSSELYASAEIGPGDRILRAGAVQFEYDTEGNLVSRAEGANVVRYEYDAANRLITVRRPDGIECRLEYDASGRLARKTVGDKTTDYFWLDRTIFRIETSGGASTDLLFLPSSFWPAALTVGGRSMSTILDQLGTPRELADHDGTIVWQSSSDAFGFELTGAECPIGFQGQYRDADIGLNYNYFRFYDPRYGRYVTQDPLGLRASLNLYAYVTNPVNWIDPLGLFTITLSPRCDWNKDQLQEFEDKVDRYNQAIEKKKPGIPITDCDRKDKDLKALCTRCQKAGLGCSDPTNSTPSGKGKKVDCTQDMDHIVDVQMGGPQDYPDVCSNLTPVNSSVNRSCGSQVKNQIAANMTPSDNVLTKVIQGERECPDKTPRTPGCN
jgi:RHS repeat-associated protein